MGKDSGLVIALVCDRTLQSIIPLQISSSFFTKSAEEPNIASICNCKFNRSFAAAANLLLLFRNLAVAKGMSTSIGPD